MTCFGLTNAIVSFIHLCLKLFRAEPFGNSSLASTLVWTGKLDAFKKVDFIPTLSIAGGSISLELSHRVIRAFEVPTSHPGQVRSYKMLFFWQVGIFYHPLAKCLNNSHNFPNKKKSYVTVMSKTLLTPPLSDQTVRE